MSATALEQFITDRNVRLDTLSGPERVTLQDGWDVNRYRLRLSSDHHNYDFNYHLGLALNAEEELVVAPILAALIIEEDYRRSGEAPAGDMLALAHKKGKDLVLLLGGEESYESLVVDAFDY